ncbi:unnamed protein product [Ectocarpus sp. 12 AP-2014]
MRVKHCVRVTTETVGTVPGHARVASVTALGADGWGFVRFFFAASPRTSQGGPGNACPEPSNRRLSRSSVHRNGLLADRLNEARVTCERLLGLGGDRRWSPRQEGSCNAASERST